MVEITKNNGKIILNSPYHPVLPGKAKNYR